MKRPLTQGSAAGIALALVGTASIIYGNSLNSNEISLTNFYPYEYTQSQELMYSGDYLLKHELMRAFMQGEIAEPLVEMPIVKKVKMKFKKPTPLEFVSMEDDEDFIL